MFGKLLLRAFGMRPKDCIPPQPPRIPGEVRIMIEAMRDAERRQRIRSRPKWPRPANTMSRKKA
jgi:hypothetical protein